METIPEKSALILVVVINNPRDLEIARVLGWYRIPLRSAPKIVSVDYLAFYQTSAFGAEKWRIRTFAPVLGHELTTRAELLHDEPDHPHANHEYYKIQLGPLLQLPAPIMADKWRRITFFYSTGEHFQEAETINDLLLASEERPIIWQALRERANRNQEYLSEEIPDMNLDPSLLAALLGFNRDLITD